jgi:hypothetical protein
VFTFLIVWKMFGVLTSFAPRRGVARFLLAAILSPIAAAGGIHRDYSSLKPSYDYVVAGGGLTGLVVGTRLSENPNSTLPILFLSTAID